MKLCRFDDNRLGLVEDETVADVSSALDILPTVRWPAPHGDSLIANLDAIRVEVERVSGAAKRVAHSEITLLSPVANPTKVIGAPVNYLAHKDEATTDQGVSFGLLLLRGDRQPAMHLRNPIVRAIGCRQDGRRCGHRHRRVQRSQRSCLRRCGSALARW